MFIRYDVHIERPPEDCRRALSRRPEDWLPPSLVEREGDRRFLTRVGFGLRGARLSKRVELLLDDPVRQGDWLVTGVRWRATGPSELFPEMDGKLTLEPLGPQSSKLSLSGTYEPPLGGLGREIDGAVLHNVAEATIRDFAEGVASRVAQLATSTT